MTGLETKEDVVEFWERSACGEEQYLTSDDRRGFIDQQKQRYALEPFIPRFACFDSSAGMKVLEIGVGLGADHQRFAEAGAELYGVDLTERAVDFTQRRLELFGLKSNVQCGDAEELCFPNNFFDVVYSWGVIHHTPNTLGAVDEIFRVLKPGGEAKVMIYHKHSVLGYMLWIRYALFGFRPFIGLTEIYSRYLESPGTKAFSRIEAQQLFGHFNDVEIETVLTHGDLLVSAAGQRHRGFLLNVARRIWPRQLIRLLFPTAGLFMLIKAKKPG